MKSETRQTVMAASGAAIALLLLITASAAWAVDEQAKPAVPAQTVASAEAQDDGAVEVSDEHENEADTEVVTAKPRLELYGFVMTDMGYFTTQIDPNWFDVIRPTKLPAYDQEFGPDGNTYFSVRQTRFGVKSWFPTKLGEAYGIFEFELFGVGVDAGQTTFRLRHAYFELGAFGVGQYWSPFMDADVFPNSLEYWGPSGMVFFRNIQVRWMPIRGATRLTIALERPGASGDQGNYDDYVELDDVKAHFPLPDLSAEYRLAGDWGYVELAGILRYIKWDDLGTDQYDLGGSATGWGLNLSSNLRLGEANTLRLQVVYGEGVENYMNDATVDIGIEPNPDDPLSPIKGVAIPLLGTVAFLDHNWSEKFSTAVGFSTFDMDNTSGQRADAFAAGRYALVNLLYYPVRNMMCGAELQYGYRENFSDGWSVDDFKVQFSFRYSFSHTMGGAS